MKESGVVGNDGEKRKIFTMKLKFNRSSGNWYGNDGAIFFHACWPTHDKNEMKKQQQQYIFHL